ncbi:MAG TPA: serine--tRNA ligase, partial [Deferrisomatales bacterium]|nr:serine--tRNA ligase [Deferrisomatales bacterium]
MLPIKLLRENTDLVRLSLRNRGSDLDVDQMLDLDERRRSILSELEELRSRRNQVSKEIGRHKKEGLDATPLFGEMQGVGARIKELEAALQQVEPELDQFLMEVPNIPHVSVPAGTREEDNILVRSWGEPRTFSFTARPHWEVGEALGILDFERAARMTGARFVVLKNAGARLERALIQFMLDLHTGEHGYQEILPPFMVNSRAMTGTGQLPKFEEDLFKLRGTDYYLIPTAEVPVTNLHMDEVLDEGDLPVCYAAYTPCFRA